MSFRRFAATLLGTTVAFTAIGLVAFAAPAMADGTTPEGFTYVTGPGNTATITNYTPGTADVIIPDTIVEGGTAYAVTAIGDDAFRSNSLTSVTIPDSVTTIGNAAFYNNNLTTLTIGNSVTTISNSAFHDNNLTTLTIPGSVTTIGTSAFQDNNLTTLTIPDSVTAIGDFAFDNNNLTKLTIGNSVTTIGNSAFRDNNLTTLTIPNSVTTIGNNTFADNPNFSSAVFNGNAPATVGTDIFGNPSPLPTVFYYDGATGFTNPWTSRNYPTQVVSGAASSLTITPSGPVISDGTSAYTATLTVMSGTPGTPVAGFPADFTIPAEVNASATSCVTDAAGTCTITLTSTAAGTYAIGALSGATPSSLLALVTFGAPPGPAGVPGLAASGIETGPAPYALGGALVALGLILTTVARRRRKAVA